MEVSRLPKDEDDDDARDDMDEIDDLCDEDEGRRRRGGGRPSDDERRSFALDRLATTAPGSECRSGDELCGWCGDADGGTDEKSREGEPHERLRLVEAEETHVQNELHKGTSGMRGEGTGIHIMCVLIVRCVKKRDREVCRLRRQRKRNGT